VFARAQDLALLHRLIVPPPSSPLCTLPLATREYAPPTTAHRIHSSIDHRTSHTPYPRPSLPPHPSTPLHTSPSPSLPSSSLHTLSRTMLGQAEVVGMLSKNPPQHEAYQILFVPLPPPPPLPNTSSPNAVQPTSTTNVVTEDSPPKRSPKSSPSTARSHSAPLPSLPPHLSVEPSKQQSLN
jgi:hypothetical protein